MKCRDCNAYEGPNLKDLMRHKTTDCPAHSGAPEPAPPATAKASTPAPDGKPFIPLAQCPEEVRYLSPGNYIGFRVLAKVVPGGVILDDIKYIVL